MIGLVILLIYKNNIKTIHGGGSLNGYPIYYVYTCHIGCHSVCHNTCHSVVIIHVVVAGRVAGQNLTEGEWV